MFPSDEKKVSLAQKCYAMAVLCLVCSFKVDLSLCVLCSEYFFMCLRRFFIDMKYFVLNQVGFLGRVIRLTKNENNRIVNKRGLVLINGIIIKDFSRCIFVEFIVYLNIDNFEKMWMRKF